MSRMANRSRIGTVQRVIAGSVLALIATVPVFAAGSEVADAAARGDQAGVRALIQRKADVNMPQVDGTTALHWAVRADNLDLADLLIAAGANVSAANREGVT